MKPKIAFICIHNSCRSQMAEVLGKLFASDVLESYSAGTELRPQINQDAQVTVKIMELLYNTMLDNIVDINHIEVFLFCYAI